MTSKKHQEFVKEPMGNKSVRTLPGIGDISGRKLEEKGFDRAKDVFAQYLEQKGGTALWLKNPSGVKVHQAKATADCLEALVKKKY